MGRVGLYPGNITWCFMTHGTIIQIVHGDGGIFIIIIIIIIIHETVLFNTLLRHWTASQQQLTVANKEQRWILSLTLTEIIVPSSPKHHCIHNEVTITSKYDLRKITKGWLSCYSDQQKKSRC